MSELDWDFKVFHWNLNEEFEVRIIDFEKRKVYVYDKYGIPIKKPFRFREVKFSYCFMGNLPDRGK